MIDPAHIKNEYTRQLVGSLLSLNIMEIISCFESPEFIEIMFRVDKESYNMWQGMLKRLLFSNVGKLFVCKKYLLKEGELSFAWTVIVTSKTLEEDVLRAANYITEIISPKEHKKAHATRQQPKSPSVRTFSQASKSKFMQPKVMGQSNQGAIIHWEMPLPHANAYRNIPKEGSTKGAFAIDPDGASREFIKKAHPTSRSGKIR